jgi:hypothetical protein
MINKRFISFILKKAYLPKSKDFPLQVRNCFKNGMRRLYVFKQMGMSWPFWTSRGCLQAYVLDGMFQVVLNLFVRKKMSLQMLMESVVGGMCSGRTAFAFVCEGVAQVIKGPKYSQIFLYLYFVFQMILCNSPHWQSLGGFHRKHIRGLK